MKKYFFAFILVFGLAWELEAGPIPLYENFGNVTNVPQVDAVAFANYGEFDVSSTLPYDTQNTLYFTNRGTMNGVPGFRFDNVSDDGSRHAASNFVNYSGASVLAGAGSQGFSFGGASPFFFGGSLENPGLITSATNIVNHGLLSVGATGLLRLSGHNLDLSRGGLEVEVASRAFAGFCFPGGSPLLTTTNFIPDRGVYDAYWFITNQTFSVANNLGINSGTVSTPPHLSARQFRFGFPPNACYFTNFTLLSVPGANAYVNFIRVTPTNWLYETVFVADTDPRVANDVRFYPSTIITNPYNTVIVQLTSSLTNIVEGTNDLNEIYLMDMLASETNQNWLTNLVSARESACPTFMPATYTLSRGQPCEFGFGASANSNLFPNIFFEPGTTRGFTNGMGTNITITNITVQTASGIVSNIYSAYGASVSNILVKVPDIPGVSVTNLPGRVEIAADSLDLTRTRVRGEGSITVKTKHLIGSAKADLDSENLVLDLASTNGNLVIQDLAKTQVERFYGNVFAWSGLWTNQLLVIEDVITNGVSSGAVTNTIEIGFHALIVDGEINTQKPVLVRDLAARSTNVTIRDNFVVSDSLLIDAENLTLTGNMSLGLSDWNKVVAPKLNVFTNSGSLSIPNEANFGADRNAPYAIMVNQGTIDAFVQKIRADEFDNTGLISGSGDIFLDTQSGKLDSGSFIAGRNVYLTGSTLKVRSHNITASGGLFLQVTNQLTDAGTAGRSTWSVNNGFHLLAKPGRGDLFGTTLASVAPYFANPLHSWAAEDRGATPAGYSNNAAIGNLTLDTSTEGLLTFSSVDASNGLYVDFLNLSASVANDLTNKLEILPGLTIYFAAASVPAEQLDGQLGGRLRWVRDFAGPNSSTNVVLADGRVIVVNSALRYSMTIDSDADGVVNGLDPQPFDGVVIRTVTLTNVPPLSVLLSWRGASNAIYHVDSTTNLSPPQWQPRLAVTNTAPTNTFISVQDPFSPSEVQRYYRVWYSP